MKLTGHLRRTSPLVVAVVTLSLVVTLPEAQAEKTPGSAADVVEPVQIDPELPEAALIEVPDQYSLSLLAGQGIDLAHWNEPTDEGRVRSVAFVTSEDRDLLAAMDVQVLATEELPTPEETQAQLMGNVDEVVPVAPTNNGVGRGRGSAGKPAPVAEEGSLRVLRADTFENHAGTFIAVEVRNLRGASAPVSIEFANGDSTRTVNLSQFSDAGQYLYHRNTRPVLVNGDAPTEVTVRSNDGTELTVPTNPWAEWDETGYPQGFQWGFITTGYPDAVDSYTKIEQLAAEFPDLAEVVELPHKTPGYRRPAMLTYGSFTNTAVVLRSQAFGHEGGNDLTFQISNPGAANRPLTVSVDGNDITVLPATNASGALTSTAAQVIAALNADPVASELVYAHPYRGNAAGGTVTAGNRSGLSDFLNAPEDKISREPATVKAIRIGKHRDGSKTGVFAYSQEHAREWVTPMVGLEAAERLLRNYGSDPESTAYVDELDIFILPVVNPDGTNYSLYDFASQRRNLNNYCPDAESDPAYRNAWGVDLNRNFTIGSRFDGYNGASASCRSDTFSGPAELSEAETKNELWLVDNHPNIRFSMNIHSHGGYFMWAPGAYITPGRIPLPRPNVGVEDYFFDASQTILGRIAEHRGTVIHPGRTGPTIDVLYSAAGNSADDMWYRAIEEGRDPIYAWNFEVGAERYTGSGSTGWSGVGGFFPNFANEGFDQAMEFANGMYGLFEVALDFQQDDAAPKTTVNVTNGGWYDGAVDVEFDVSEPSTIYYTTDGSRPTFDSPVVERRDVRDSAAPIRISESTTLRWFAVDAAGNVEGGYRPDGNGHDYQRVHIRIREKAPSPVPPGRPTPRG